MIVLLPLLIGLFVRVYRLPDLLGFYFDQGRDALIVWDLWHAHKIFLVGPTTGIEGIFLGPFYYYLIAPFYLLGQGNPVIPAIFLSLLNAAALFILYRLTHLAFGKWPSLIAVTLAAISYVNIYDQRWLSNPNPLTFFSLLIYWFLYKIINGQSKYLSLVCFLVGLCLQLEAASAIFFIPSLLLTLILFRKNIPLSFKTISLSLISISITFVPQLYFDFRHDHILFNAFKNFLITNKSFGGGGFNSIYPARLNFFYSALTQRLFLNHGIFTPLFLIASIISLARFKNSPPFLKVIFIWLFVPVFFLSIYTGNHGYVWDYYLTGIYPLTFMLAGLILYQAKIIGFILVIVSLFLNFTSLHHYLTQPLKTPGLVTLGTSLNSVDWVYRHSQNRSFNVDSYVPPVISHSYNYLFLWRGTTKFSTLPSSQIVPRLYTIYEVDGQHPDYLTAWLARQDSYGKVSESVSLGGVSAQSRLRYEK